MRTLNDLVVLASRSASLFLLSLLITVGSLAIVFPGVNAVMQETVGHDVFDMQNTLTVEQVFKQLEAYAPETKQLYYAFSFVDFLFPFFASLLNAAVAAYALRVGAPELYRQCADRALFAWLFVPAAFDWLENVAALGIVGAYPEQRETLASLMIWAKQAKLFSLVVAQAVVLGSVLLGLWKWARVRLGATR